MFNDILKELRLGKKWTQGELGQKLHVSDKTIGSWERGTRQPNLETINKIATIFEVSTDYLLGMGTNNIFGLRLKKLRSKTNETQDAIARKIGISRAVYSHLENGRNEPDNETLIKLASHYNVTTDYLLGHLERNKNTMIGGKIKQLRKQHHLSQEDLASKIGVTQTTVTAWENNKSIPGADTLLFIADYFKVSADELLGRNTNYHTNNLDEMIDIADTFRDVFLLPKDKRIIRGIIKGYLDS